ncbi:MAG: chemotaxis protein CheB [Bacteroidota bacterium]
MSAYSHNFPIVGIGASAGGLKAIEEILLHLPEDTGMAFVIIQHLSRRFKSMMKEILVKDTRMEVIMAENGMKVYPNNIYLIPAGNYLTIEEGRLNLRDQEMEDAPHFVIDNFLHSLGQDVGPRGIAVILSGTGSDGSRGIRTIKNRGGVVVVQEPESGEFDGMPLSAIDTRLVDYILHPEEIAEKLVSLSLEPIPLLEENQEEPTKLPLSDESVIEDILDLVRKYFEIDFASYKSNTIWRRIEKDMIAQKFHKLQDYYLYLAENPDHVGHLLQELLIGVTEFFRDPGAYDSLRENVFPNLINASKDRQEIRIWDCACSTGQEVYSLAIALHEYAEEVGFLPKFTFFATDVDERALQIASKAQYSPSKVKGVSQDILDKYFEYNGENYEVRKFIRDLIIFARNDAMVDPPFINLDLVACRNLLIYLRPIVQRRIILNFHFGLKPGGFLWLGASENVLDYKNNFKVLSEKWKVYTSYGETPKFRKYYNLNLVNKRGKSFPSIVNPGGNKEFVQTKRPKIQLTKLLISKFAPACIMINEEFEILYTAGGAGQYLNFPDMESNLSILNMVQDDLIIIIRDAIRRFVTESGPFLYPNVPIESRSGVINLDLIFEDLGLSFGQQIYLVQFKEYKIEDLKASPTIVKPVSKKAEVYDVIRDLQEELKIAKHEVQNSLEELETSNEELQSSNEELLAANEELQSTNEELQSVNEELYTVNSELQIRNKELYESRANLDNLLNSIDLGVLFLDSELNIKLFTPQFSNLILLDDKDVGTSIEKFSIRWDYPRFMDDIMDVLIGKKNDIVREVQMKANNGHIPPYYYVRINPYKVGLKTEGVIVMALDVSKRKYAELALAKSEQNQRRILEIMPIITSIINLEGEIIFRNQSENGYKLDEIVGKTIYDLMPEQERPVVKSILDKVVRTEVPGEYQVQLVGEGGKQIIYENKVFPLTNSTGEIDELLVVSTDSSSSVMQERALLQEIATLNAFLQFAPVLHWFKDETFRYIFVNDYSKGAYFDPSQKVVGNNDFGLFNQEVANSLRYRDEQILATGEMHHQVDQIIDREGKKRNILFIRYLVDSPLKEDTKYIGTIGLEIDKYLNETKAISEGKKKLEQVVEERTQSLISANQNLRNFTNSIAHDLRSPIRAILSYSQFLAMQAKDQFSDEQNRYIQNITNQAQRMGELIDSLVGFARIGSYAVRKEWLELEIIARDIFSNLSYMTDDIETELIVRDCPRVWADLELTRQTITNLFSNAIKYNQRKEKRIIEFGGYPDKSKLEIIYYVKDNGIGFDPIYAEKIFGLFERIHPELQEEGSGIGLSIVKRAVELQNGAVWATSEVGLGSTFYFSLPMKPS